VPGPNAGRGGATRERRRPEPRQECWESFTEAPTVSPGPPRPRARRPADWPPSVLGPESFTAWQRLAPWVRTFASAFQSRLARTVLVPESVRGCLLLRRPGWAPRSLPPGLWAVLSSHGTAAVLQLSAEHAR
jgi:hypothetical protein